MKIDPFDFKTLIAPLTPEVFFEKHWEKESLVLQRDASGYAGLITLSDVEFLLSTLHSPRERLHNSIPWVRFINNKKELQVEPYLDRNGYSLYNQLSGAKVLEGYKEGNTIVLNALEFRWEPVMRLCCMLQEVFGHSVGTNLYLTPPNAQGFAAHYDPHDVFILQIHGEKLWKIYDSQHPFPIGNEDKPWSHPLGDPVHELALKPGDLLYIPRGHVHEASTATNHSLHLTVGINVLTWVDFFSALAKNNGELRRALPKDFLEKESITVKDLMEWDALQNDAKHEKSLNEAFGRVKKQLQRKMTKPFDFGLANYAQSVDIEGDTILKKREGKTVIAVDQEALHFSWKGLKFESEASFRPLFEKIASGSHFSVNTLPGDPSIKWSIVWQLMEAGVLEWAESHKES